MLRGLPQDARVCLRFALSGIISDVGRATNVSTGMLAGTHDVVADVMWKARWYLYLI
jgi:hypothetical protein